MFTAIAVEHFLAVVLVVHTIKFLLRFRGLCVIKKESECDEENLKDGKLYRRGAHLED